MLVWSVVFSVLIGLVVATRSPIGAVAVVFGNRVRSLQTRSSPMRGNERLLDHRSVSTFVISSILRIAVFGIVPVEFALHGPLWTMAAYFAGFFTPLALYAGIAYDSARRSNGIT